MFLRIKEVNVWPGNFIVSHFSQRRRPYSSQKLTQAFQLAIFSGRSSAASACGEFQFHFCPFNKMFTCTHCAEPPWIDCDVLCPVEVSKPLGTCCPSVVPLFFPELLAVVCALACWSIFSFSRAALGG